MLHLLEHSLYALGVRDIGADADCFTAGAIDGVDDWGVGVRIAGEESDGVGAGEFASDGCAGLCLVLLLVLVSVFDVHMWVERGRGRERVADAWADAGDDGDGFAGHGAEVGDEGEETGGWVHELERFDGREGS